MSFQSVNGFPLFHNRHAILVCVLVADVCGGIDCRAVFDAADFLQYVGDDFVEFRDEVVAISGGTLNGGDNDNHVFEFLSGRFVGSV